VLPQVVAARAARSAGAALTSAMRERKPRVSCIVAVGYGGLRRGGLFDDAAGGGELIKSGGASKLNRSVYHAHGTINPPTPLLESSRRTPRPAMAVPAPAALW